MYRVLSIQDYDGVIDVLKCLGMFEKDSEDLRDVIEYCLNEGDSRGVVIDGKLAGFILAVNYDTVPESVFCKLFGCSSYADLPGGGTIHNALRSKWFVTYIVSLLAIQSSVVSELVSGFTSEFGKGTIVADPGNREIYNAYTAHGYIGVELDAGRFYVSHVGTANYNISL